MPHFECGAFDHSATSPKVVLDQSGPPLNVAAFGYKRDFVCHLPVRAVRTALVLYSHSFRIIFVLLANVSRSVVDLRAGMAYPTRNLRHRSVLWGVLFNQPVQTG